MARIRSGVEGIESDLVAGCKRFGGHPLAVRLIVGVILTDPEHPGHIRSLDGYHFILAATRYGTDYG